LFPTGATTRIAVLVDDFDAGQRASAQEREHRSEVVRRPITEPQCQHLARLSLRRRERPPAQVARRHAVGIAKCGIETPQAAEARGQRDLGDRQRGFGQQLLGEQQATRTVHADRCGAEALHEQASQLPLADVDAPRQFR
jgi:hypothetical protein